MDVSKYYHFDLCRLCCVMCDTLFHITALVSCASKFICRLQMS